MPWNGSGTFSASDTVTGGTTATAAEVNAIISDLATGVNTALAKDGQNVMTGQLKAANGTVSAPSITFGSDLNTGIYRVDADEIGIAAGGTKIAEVTSAGLDVTSGNVLQGGAILLPPGIVAPYAGATAPGGWLLCYGQAVSRETYAELFAVVDTTYGAGDESTTFNVPDLRGRVPAGKDDMGGSAANRLTDQSGGVDGSGLGEVGGSETHELIEDENAEHTHGAGSFAAASHNHTYTRYNDLVAFSSGGGSQAWQGTSTINTGNSGSLAVSGTSAASGSGDPHNNVQPTIILNYIIKT